MLCHEEWADVGKHFRSYEHIAYFMDTMPKNKEAEHGVEVEGSQQFLEVEHGKGWLDGHFGRMRRWTMEIAKKVTISAIGQYVRLLQGRANHAMKDDPEGPRYRFIHFKPPARANYGKQKMDGPAMGILYNSTYSLTSVNAGGGKRRVANHVLAGRKPVSQCCFKKFVGKGDLLAEDDELVVDLVLPAPVGKDGWRRASRKVAPEKEKPEFSKIMN